MPEPEPLAPGTVVAGRYEVERRLGAGGPRHDPSPRVLHAARDRQMGVVVALEVASVAEPLRAAARARFARAARVGNRLGRSPGYVRVFDRGELDLGARLGLCLFLAMDLIEGARALDLETGELATRLRKIETAARLVAAAHAQGVLHRALSPRTILEAKDGSLWLTDFTSAKETERAGPDPADADAGFGEERPELRAPELLRGGAGDERADVYSLGALLRAALAHGRLPGAEPALALLAEQATAPDPAQRPASASELADRIAAALEPPHTLPAHAPEPAETRPAETALAPAPPAPAPPAETVRAPTPSAAPPADRVLLGVVPLVVEGESPPPGTFEPLVAWERFLLERRFPGGGVEAHVLRARSAGAPPLEVARDSAFVSSIFLELGAGQDALFRAYAVKRADAWAVVVRCMPATLPDDANHASWSTGREVGGAIWSSPSTTDAVEFAEALRTFGAADWVASGPAASPFREALAVLGRLEAPETVVGRPIPEAVCASCGIGSFHGLLAHLARGDRPEELAVLGVRFPDRVVRISATDLARPFACPNCAGTSVRIRFAVAWDPAPADLIRTLASPSSPMARRAEPAPTRPAEPAPTKLALERPPEARVPEPVKPLPPVRPPAREKKRWTTGEKVLVGFLLVAFFPLGLLAFMIVRSRKS